MAGEYPAVMPMIAYEDGIAAIEWLTRAFGFHERREARQLGPDGSLSHAEMEVGDGLIMLATPTPAYQSPKHHRETCEAARRWSAVPWVIDGVLVFVKDLAAHYERAKRAGRRFFRNLRAKRPIVATEQKTSKGIGGSSNSVSDRGG